VNNHGHIKSRINHELGGEGKAEQDQQAKDHHTNITLCLGAGTRYIIYLERIQSIIFADKQQH
jgi:hypothetical protein